MPRNIGMVVNDELNVRGMMTDADVLIQVDDIGVVDVGAVVCMLYCC